MKKKIYLVQASAVYGESVKSAYLPYAAGCLAAYAFADERIKAEYELGRFIFIREDIDKAVASLEEPYFVGFSSYIWNMEYNRVFAKKLKEKYPDVIIAFGGHNVKPDGSDLEEIPEADIIMHGEGETVFKDLLLALSEGRPYSTVNGISFRENGSVVNTPAGEAADIASFPSPYTEGYFDDIIRDSGINPSVIWETNRGCPNRCAFCDWGALKSKIRMFPDSRIKAELAWMVKNKIEFVYCADANFGLFERDEKITDLIIESKNKNGYPKVFKTNYAKNKDDVVFEISNKLMKNRIGKSPTLSFQSLSPVVLQNIGRSNMELEHFKSLMTRYNAEGVHVYSELILGLPGETYDSFADGMCTLLDCNQHTAIGIYPCELLPNSLLGSREYRERFDIRTVNTTFTQYHIKMDDNDVSERSHAIISTSTMSMEDWKRSYIFATCVQALHNLALTRAIAIYLRKEKNIGYRDFYESLIGWFAGCGEDTVSGRLFRKISELTDGITKNRNSFSYIYGDEEKLTWGFEEFMFIFLMKNSDTFYTELEDFMERFGLEEDILGDLMLYQREVMKKPGKNEFSVELGYDFYNYFKRIYTDCYSPLEKKKNTLYTTDKSASSWDEWSRICVWYGRRDDAQLFTGRYNTVEQKFCNSKEDGMKKNIYMVQATYINGKTVPIPYAVGALAAYALKDSTVAENYELAEIIFLRENIDDVIARMEDPFYVGFSSYIWNYEYNKAFAEKLKKKYPGCIIQFGGHQVAPGGSLLEECPYVDIAVHNEGEEPFRLLLLEYLKEHPDFSAIPNISYRDGDRIINNPCVVFDGEDYPSPYIEGIFDRLIEDHPDLTFDALLETNRGCPNRCTYCGWGMYKGKIRMFPMERIYGDIKWVSDHKIEFLAGADANFGLFDRDDKIVDWIIDFKKRTGYPDKFQVSYAKNSTERIFDMTKKLHAANMDKGVTLAFQSLEPQVLDNIGRSNIKLDHYSNLLQMYAGAGIPTYSDLILGLPGETYDTFVSGVNTLLKAGQHSSLFIHILEWLPCSAMGAKEYMERFGLEYTVLPLNQPHRVKTGEDSITEYSRIVTKTSTMDNAEWIRMNMFSACVQCFHHLGLLEFVALYCFYTLGIEYGDFYNGLLEYLDLHPDTVAGEVFARVKKHFVDVIEKGGPVVFVDEKYAGVSWTAEEYAFLEIVRNKKQFYEEIRGYTDGLGIASDILDELMAYQYAMIKTVNNRHDEIEMHYDFREYFKGALAGKPTELAGKNIRLIIDDPDTFDNWKDYARFVVWYGRRGGKNIYLSEAKFEEA